MGFLHRSFLSDASISIFFPAVCTSEKIPHVPLCRKSPQGFFDRRFLTGFRGKGIRI